MDIVARLLFVAAFVIFGLHAANGQDSTAGAKLKLDEARVGVQVKHKADLTKLSTATGSAQVTFARALLPKLQSQLQSAKDDFEKVAVLELLLTTAEQGGKHKEAIQAYSLLTPEQELFTPAYFEKEIALLENAKANPANLKASFVQTEIAAEIKKRKAVLESLTAIAADPQNTERYQQIGEYLFFEQGVEQGLPFLANGVNPLHRILAAKPADPVAWWDSAANETNAKYKARMLEYALQLFMRDSTLTAR